MNKRKTLTSFLCLTALWGFSQEKSQIENGVQLITDKPIMATCYTFSRPIYHMRVDSTNRNIYLELRDKNQFGLTLGSTGQMQIFNTEADSAIWKSSMRYPYDWYALVNGSFLWSGTKNSRLIDLNSGKEIWRKDIKLSIAFPEMQIGCGYPTNNDTLCGIRLMDGSKLWSKALKRADGWDHYGKFNDSCVLISSSGLHMLNLYNGKGWDRTATTSIHNFSPSKEGTNPDDYVLLDLYGVPRKTDKGILNELCSQPLIDSGRIYCADHVSLSCTGANGQNAWTYEFTKGMAAKSALILKNDTLLMLNMGYGVYNSHFLANFGTPFIAGFDKRSGQKLFFRTLPRINILNAGYYMTRNNIIFMNNKNKYVLSFKDGPEFVQKAGDDTTYWTPTAPNLIHIRSGDEFSKIASNPEYIYVYAGNSLLELNDNLETLRKWPVDQVYINYLNTEKYSFMGREGETLVLDKNKKAIALLSVSPICFHLNHKLYEIRGNKLTITDISGL